MQCEVCCIRLAERKKRPIRTLDMFPMVSIVKKDVCYMVITDAGDGPYMGRVFSYICLSVCLSFVRAQQVESSRMALTMLTLGTRLLLHMINAYTQFGVYSFSRSDDVYWRGAETVVSVHVIIDHHTLTE